MTQSNRRTFLVRVGQGMFVAGLGSKLAIDLELSPALADDSDHDRLTFGALEPLVSLMQETPAEALLPKLRDEVRRGTPLKSLVAAGALANARMFGGDDYIGFHTFMALAPAYFMSQKLPSDRSALPVLKVLYRNSNRIQEQGGHEHEVLHPIAVDQPHADQSSIDALRDAVHARDLSAAEQTLIATTRQSVADAWDALLTTVEEAPEVHRIVLAERAWEMLDVVGPEYADVMLRQSVHYCVRSEESSVKYFSPVRTLLPKLLDQYHLLSGKRGDRSADDAWLDNFSATLFAATADQAADAVAAALAEGILPDDIGHAISLAANQLVLRDAGRPPEQSQPNKPPGSVHGDSIGVHACDSMNAWRRISRGGVAKQQASSLIMAAYQVALDRTNRGGKFLEWKPRPHEDELQAVRGQSPGELLQQLDGAIREQNQSLACAITHRYGELGYSADEAFNLLLRYATSEDGALHAEKFYRTCSDEFASSRPSFRWRHIVALARVTASCYGQPAPGYKQACELLGVSV